MSPRSPFRLLAAAASMLVALPAGASGSDGGSGGGTPAYVALLPITVPVVDGARADGRLLVTLTIEARDPASAALLGGRMPQLREASIAAAGEFARLRVSPGRAVDASMLAASLDAALRGREATIAHVLIVNVRAERA